MKILAVGGGSGGHVTPVAAVITELKSQSPGSEIRYWCDNKYGSEAKMTMREQHSDVQIRTVVAGKFRRFHAIPIWTQLANFRSIVLPNTIDVFKIGIGTIQSLCRLVWWRPDVIFAKGGFVCLPVGIAAHILRIPLVIHDSDTHPGLTSRVLSRWAVSIGTGAPLENYNYPASKAHFVGIPVSKQLVVLGVSQRAALKQELGLSSRPLVLITGGGLGAKRINDATVAVADRLVADCTTLLVCGVGQYSELQDAVTHLSAKDFKLVPHVVSSEFVRLLSAADIVVSRAGATTMLELAALAKPTILIPNARLTGGHQLKNANAYEKKHAAVIVNDEALETEPDVLATAIHELLADTSMRERLATAIHQFATPHAARDMARLILAAKKH